MTVKETLCPMCKRNILKKPIVRFCSLSRRDNKTYICNDCGNREAMADYYSMIKEREGA
jgi:predicted RNA-binding Zn-ribbon protein involved in translation (DUF1610 family)